MLKVPKPTAESFQIFYFPVQRFDGAVGETAAVKFSGTMFFHHNERIEDRVFILAEKFREIDKNFFPAVKVEIDDVFKP